MDVTHRSLDVYLPLFSQSSPLALSHSTPLVAFKKSSLGDDHHDVSGFASPVDGEDDDLLSRLATTPFSHKTPASSRSSVHTPTSRSSTSAHLDDSRHSRRKRALSPFTPQDFDKAYPLQFKLSPQSISPVIRTSSPDYDSLGFDPDSCFPFKKRCLQESPQTPQKSPRSTAGDDLSPLSSISSLSDASSDGSPLASRSYPVPAKTRRLRIISPPVAAASQLLGLSRRPSIRQTLSTSRALGSPAYRRRKLESAALSSSPRQHSGQRVRRHPLSRTSLSTSNVESTKPTVRKPSVQLRIRPLSPPEPAETEDSPTISDETADLPQRTFPSKVKFDPQFSLFYIRYPVYSCAKEDTKRWVPFLLHEGVDVLTSIVAVLAP